MPRLDTQPIHLGLGASAIVEPAFTGNDWYEAYAARHEGDGVEGRVVMQYAFSESWGMWEVHPLGAEVVLCVDGRVTLIQQGEDGGETRVTLEAGDYAINPPGVWHTADIAPGEHANCVFITAGAGTDHRPR